MSSAVLAHPSTNILVWVLPACFEGSGDNTKGQLPLKLPNQFLVSPIASVEPLELLLIYALS